MKRKAPSSQPSVPYTIKTRSQTEAEKQSKPHPAPKQDKDKKLPTRKSARLSKSKPIPIPEEQVTMSSNPRDTKKKTKPESKSTVKSTEQDESEEESKSSSSSETSPVSSTSALQGLMRRLGGAALEELLPPGREGQSITISTLIEGRARLKTLLQGLKSDNESQQLECIMELCDYLSIGTEESLAGFAIDQFVPALINLLNCEHNPDMMRILRCVLACRALSHLMEALPASCASIVHHGAVASLCSKLLSIEYIDLAEQSLQALEKLSVEHPTSILRAGGLTAVLTYLDFFPTGVQRVAVATAANICRQVPMECFDMVVDSIPILTNLLQYSDQKENTCLCFLRLAESCYGAEDKLQILTSHGLLSQLVRLISVSTTAMVISPGTYTIIVRLLADICQGAPSLVLPLLQEGIASLLQGVLGSTDSSASLVNTAVSKSPVQCYEILSLVNELLPRLPSEIADLMSLSTKLVHRERTRKLKKAIDSDTKGVDTDVREEMFNTHPELLVNLGQSLFSVLVDMFASTVNPSVRYKCLSSITKILYFSTADMLKDLLRNLAFSSFLAGLLASRDYAIVAVALTVSEIMMEKLPTVFSKYFRREGVVYEVERLTKIAINSSPSHVPIAPSSPVHNPLVSHSLAPPPMSSSPSSNALFHVGSPASVHTSTTLSTPNEDMKSLVYSKARNFHQKYFKKLLVCQLLHTLTEHQQGDQADTSATDELIRLQELAQQLNKDLPNGKDIEILRTIRDMMASTEGVSTFEFLRSGLTESLLCYLTKLDGSSEGVLHRAVTFAEVFLELVNSSLPTKKAQAAPLAVLVTKLHDSLNKLEKFPVQVNDTPGLASGLKYLTQPFKLRLQKDGSADSIKDYSSNVVLIEPLATVSAIEDFLFPRIRDAQQLDADKGKTKGKDKDTAVEERTERTKLREKPMKKEKSRLAEDDTKPEGKRMKEEKGKEPSSEVMKMEIDDSSIDNKAAIAKEGAVGEAMDFYDEYDDYDEEVMSPSDTSDEKVHDLKLNEEAAAPSNSPPSIPLTNMKLAFFVNDQRLPSTTSIFQVIQQLARDQALESPQPIHKLWEIVYTLKYRAIPADTPDFTTEGTSTSASQINLEPVGSSSLLKFLTDLHPFSVNTSDTTYEILSLLRVLHQFNDKWPTLYNQNGSIPLLTASEFINSRLTAKLLRQLQDPLALCSGTLPSWCKQLTVACPFLFTFECRRQYLYSTSFGIARALQSLQQRNDVTRVSGERSDFRIGRIQRQKVRISRARILDSAKKVMELYGKDKAVLEVEYFGEVGTGLGPTMEFFTLVSREMQRAELQIWWNDNTSPSTTSEQSVPTNTGSEYVFSPGGLFPSPLRSSSAAYGQKLEFFKFLGCFVAKALLDSRLLDLPLSNAFFKWMLGQELDIEDLFCIAPTLAKSLRGLVQLCLSKRAIEADASLSIEQRDTKIKGLTIGGASIDDLCLDFTLPGHAGWELKANGTNISVNISNLEEYANLVLKTFLVDGVKAQFQAFSDGFSQVVPIENIHMFFVPEVETLVCGAAPSSNEHWSIDSLLDAIKADHGYTTDSQAVRFLIQIMSEFTPSEKRNFLLFLTGSTRLPISGFKGLNPRFTIVKKQHDPPLSPNDYLPSVMSCTNYLKLPDYSTMEVMKQKLLYAIEEGQASFHLS